MKSLRITVSAFLLFLAIGVFAQSDPQKSSSPAQSDAQKSFDKLKTLAGSWKGSVTTDLPAAKAALDGKPMYVTFRVTSRGNALVHEMKEPGTPDDPTKDDPITMLYLDGDRLLLTHYCDAGNRPRMTGKMSSDGKTVEFEFLDVAGNTKYGHMHHAIFTMIDANHHTEDWSFMMGDKLVHGRFDLQRTNWREDFLRKASLENRMDREWNDSQPIYRQLRDRVVAMILDGVLKEGDPLPSVRNVAAEYRVNPLTVLKGYQQLVDEGLVETRRGRGMFINSGARDLLLQGERQKFLAEQWPRISATIQRLGLKAEELLGESANTPSNSKKREEKP